VTRIPDPTTTSNRAIQTQKGAKLQRTPAKRSRPGNSRRSRLARPNGGVLWRHAMNYVFVIFPIFSSFFCYPKINIENIESTLNATLTHHHLHIC